MTVVALGGLTGGGGRLLGPKVAERLEADYVDRLILTRTGRALGATVEALHQREQRPPSFGERLAGIFQRILERSAVSGAGGDPYFGPGTMAFLTQEFEDLPQPIITRGHDLEEEEYHEALRNVMEEMAAGGNVVFVGRGAAIILRDDPKVLRVGVVATLEDRVARIMERERLDEEQSRTVVDDRDKARARYFKNHFGIDDPDDPHLYHFSINSSDVDFDYAAGVVVDACDALQKGTLPHKVDTAP